jgi:hypothetical protein
MAQPGDGNLHSGGRGSDLAPDRPREAIDEALKEADWAVQDHNAMNVHAKRRLQRTAGGAGLPTGTRLMRGSSSAAADPPGP